MPATDGTHDDGPPSRRVMGVDTALRCSGVAVVESSGSRLKAVAYGRIRNPAARPLSQCLSHLASGLAEIIERHEPTAAVIEGAFFCKNARTAMILGQARGVAVVTCAARGLPVYEYAPRRIKQAVVGFGGADKMQIRKMVVSLLALPEEPPEDEADALALAICHLHGRTGYAALMPEPI